MNVFHKVTRQTLKQNRLRTTVTIIGVILSAAMVCAVTTLVASFQGYLRDDRVHTYGDWYAQVDAAGADLKEELTQDSRVTRLASAQLLGYSASESQNVDKPYFYVLGADQSFLDSMPVHLTFGRLPETEGEVLVPEHYLAAGNGGASVKPGDCLTLELGERQIDGEPLGQNNPYQQDAETLQVRETRTYTVVGIYERPSFEDYSAPGYTLITVPQAEGPRVYDLYLKTKVKDLDAVIADHDLPNDRNWNLLAMEGEFQYSNIGSVFVGFEGILIFLIVLGSVTLIYSAFSISVSQRTRQFGLLNSVGATKKQLRRSVFYEAAVISAIGIPIGILCGIGGIAVTLHFLGDKFRSIISSQVPMTLRVSLPSVVSAVGIAVLTVLISVWIPAKRATMVTAIEAIRQNQDIQSGGRDVHVSGLTRKVFGLEGVLAKKYFHRSRKRYRATIVSLVLSLVLFISASAFCMYLNGTVEDSLTVTNYDVSCGSIAGSRLDEVLPMLMEARGVTAGSYHLREDGVTLLLDKSQVDKTYAAYLSTGGRGNDPLQDPDYTGQVIVCPEVCYVDDAAYRAFLQTQGLDESLYLDAQEVLPLVYNQGRAISYEITEEGDLTRKVYNYQVLARDMDTVQVRQEQEVPGYSYLYTDNQNPAELEQGIDRLGPVQDYYLPENWWEADETDWSRLISRDPVTSPLRLGATVTELPMGITAWEGGGLILLYPFSAAPESLKNGEITGILAFTSSDHAATAADIERILMDEGLYIGSSQVEDRRAYESTNRNLITIINVFSYGFIALISLIAAANVFNTISTNVALRRREFAMLRSVGMTRGGLNRMMNYECLLYGFRALLYGLPLSGLMTVLIYKIAGDAVSGFLVPWGAAAVAVCSIFAVVFATMLYAMGRIKRENPIDALKDENT